VRLQRRPNCQPPLQRDLAFLRAWRGDIGLYRAAYGLGGVGLALVSLLGDTLLSVSSFIGGFTSWFSYIVGGAAQLGFAWVSIVATWRAARKMRPDGRAYGRIAVGLALAFVGIQFILVTTWTAWSGLAGLGVAPEPDDILLRALIVALESNCTGIDPVCKALAIFN
jgi:hypothetical protein